MWQGLRDSKRRRNGDEQGRSATAARAGDRRRMPARTRRGARPARSVTVNLAESPLGWLFARGLVSQRQFDAGERLRCDWERAQLAPRVTMAWDAAPVARGPRRVGAAARPQRRADRCPAPVRRRGRQRRAGPGRHPVARGLRRRGDARGRDRARLAGARRQAGADACARPRRGLLPDRAEARIPPARELGGTDHDSLRFVVVAVRPQGARLRGEKGIELELAADRLSGDPNPEFLRGQPVREDAGACATATIASPIRARSSIISRPSIPSRR